MPEIRAGHIRRFSSRRQRLDESFLNERLRGAKAYDRIAGYFCGSILETAGEAIDAVEGPVRVVCNSGLDPRDVATARAAAQALRQEWCASEPERLVEAGGEAGRRRFGRLHELLRSQKLQVRVLPDKHFGMIHGKAGVITLVNGRKTAFLGSANESKAGWSLNYELIWEDDSPEAVVWVQEEFDALWGSPFAVPLAEFIIEDIKRLSHRRIIADVDDWRKSGKAESPDPPAASVFVESPVYRKQVGLWEHQKYFVKLAFESHLHSPGGARLVLADQVGLGKTIQLAMAAQLMALVGDAPILVLVPKTLLKQWQDELLELLGLPSAIWNGRQWVDENDIEHPAVGAEGIRNCPRRVGIISTGLVTRRSEAADLLKELTYECVILDEAHRARRRNIGHGREAERPDANNLLRFLYDISGRAKSMLLATATPVQLHPIEVWDLLDALSFGSEAVLGGMWSRWRRPEECLPMMMDQVPLPDDETIIWDWIRTPLPPRDEHRDFDLIRRSLELPDSVASANGSDWERLRPADRSRIRSGFGRFVHHHNPFLRHVVRRSRAYLETTIDPETNEPYLRPIGVRLYGESEDEALRLPPYLQEAYELAEKFCEVLGQRMRGAGFLKTLLLRRVGSSIEAGRSTAGKLLGEWRDVDPYEEDDDEESPDLTTASELARSLTTEERDLLERFIASLTANRERDPKYAVVVEYLRGRGWLEYGCIVFSQYFDSVQWLGRELSEELGDEAIGLYAGASRSALWVGGERRSVSREDLKTAVREGRLRLLLGTDAASEGLNLQRLGTLINLDLPWNPTRLEQRKGRIQRIGQIRDEVDVLNMRYRGSVEDRVHQLLSARLRDIHILFGQIPDVLEDVWIDVALGQLEQATRRLDAVPRAHPFDLRYREIRHVDWESCAEVLDKESKREYLLHGW